MEKIKYLYQQLEKVTTAAERIELLHQLSVQFMYIDLVRFEQTLDELHQLATKSSSLIGKYYYHQGMGRLSAKHVNYQQSLIHFGEAEKLAIEMGNQRLVGMTLYAFSIINVNLSNFETAHQQALQSVEIFKTMEGDERELSMAYTYLGITSECLGRFDDAEDAYQKAIDIAPADTDPNVLSGSLVNYVVLKIKKKQYDEALELSLLALDLMHKSNNKLGVAQTLVNTGEIYFLKGNYNEALKFYVDGLKYLKQVDNKKVLLKAYVCLADVYMALGGLSEAEEKLNLSFELLKEFTFPAAECKLNGVKGALFYRKGKVAEAKDWLEKSVAIAYEKGLLELHQQYNALLTEVGKQLAGTTIADNDGNLKETVPTTGENANR